MNIEKQKKLVKKYQKNNSILHEKIKQIKLVKKNNPFLLSDTKDFQQTTKIVEASIIENIRLIKSWCQMLCEQSKQEKLYTIR